MSVPITPNTVRDCVERPPNAPKKRMTKTERDLSKVRRRLTFEDEEEFELQLVREKFRQWNVREVEEIEDTEVLKKLHKWYSPQSQPRNSYEWTYVEDVRQAVEKRLKELS